MPRPELSPLPLPLLLFLPLLLLMTGFPTTVTGVVKVLPRLPKRDRIQYLTPPPKADKDFVNDLKSALKDDIINSRWAEETLPVGSARAVAEFEPMGGVLIAYPGTQQVPGGQNPPVAPRSFGIPDTLVVSLQQLDRDPPVHIFILADLTISETEWLLERLRKTASSMKTRLDTSLIHFVPWDTDTYWTRDYGPWWIQELDGNYNVVKHTYTTLGGGKVGTLFRPNDDYATIKLLDFLNHPIQEYNKKTSLSIPISTDYFLGLLDVGGNYMVNGNGTAASTLLIGYQNLIPGGNLNNTITRIRQTYRDFLGITEHHLLADPTGTYIGHIDCWAKFLSAKKILIGESTNGTIRAKQNKIAQIFEAKGFEVFRLETPQNVPTQDPIQGSNTTDAPYVNSLILNNHVYVPLVNVSGFESFDENALKVYEKALGDGYTVVGVPGKEDPHDWLGTDSLHCRTRGIPQPVVDNYLAAVNGLKNIKLADSQTQSCNL